MSYNAVSALRRYRLAQATRPFRARGCRVSRCDACLLPESLCLCDHIKPETARSRFCLLMFDTEPLKPSNTGRLIADILPDTQAFLWSRAAPAAAMLAAVNDGGRQPYVVFPARQADVDRTVVNHIDPNGRPPLFILLDGTWPEAGKMFRKSPYLSPFPVLSLDLTTRSRYQLRESPEHGRHCTAEVAAALLRQAGDQTAADALSRHFALFRARYLAGKSNHNR
ncbi:tRNA-uridine aminocarboxypropyltransferase [Martelella alba]|uniref:tRNA-uridine aminocarboxypropyltransferase n=1 Tax=Martelella alba TaxID=2590451 RepID=A0ABY2SIN2_9HYPH|nr:tRNA-uridine aminocarboxypropyltransferase [Martelella alba]TKI05288.1 DTW domain-containing protein [Martelella alba]